MKVGDRVVALRSDGIGRWKAGERGVLIENTYPEKYDYMVRFSPVSEDGHTYRREFYFFKDEVEPVKE